MNDKLSKEKNVDKEEKNVNDEKEEFIKLLYELYLKCDDYRKRTSN